MDNRLDRQHPDIDQKKGWIRDVIKKTLDIDRKKFMMEVTHNTGLTEKEIEENFIVEETRIVHDVDPDGKLYDVNSRIIIKRKQ